VSARTRPIIEPEDAKGLKSTRRQPGAGPVAQSRRSRTVLSIVRRDLRGRCRPALGGRETCPPLLSDRLREVASSAPPAGARPTAVHAGAADVSPALLESLTKSHQDRDRERGRELRRSERRARPTTRSASIYESVGGKASTDVKDVGSWRALAGIRRGRTSARPRVRALPSWPRDPLRGRKRRGQLRLSMLERLSRGRTDQSLV